MVTWAEQVELICHAFIGALQPCGFLDVLVVALVVSHHDFELALVQEAWCARQIMEGSGLPRHRIPGLLNGSMSSFTSLLQVASTNHFQVHFFLIVTFILKSSSSIFRHVQLLQR